jgi:hypothetical protein
MLTLQCCAADASAGTEVIILLYSSCRPSPEQRVGGVKRPSSIAVLLLLPHLLQVKVISTIRGRTWLIRVTVPRSVASLPAAASFDW